MGHKKSLTTHSARVLVATAIREARISNPASHWLQITSTVKSLCYYNVKAIKRPLYNTALLTGYRNTNGTFNNRGSNGNWWSSSATSATNAYNRNVNTGNRGVNRNSNNKANGFSVRCLKD